MRSAKMYIPRGVGEITDHLSMMMLYSPTFADNTGYFPNRNIDTVFQQLNEGLQLIRAKLGEDLYLKLIDMSDQMRAHFEADPEDKTEDTLKGRDIIDNMQNLLRGRRS